MLWTVGWMLVVWTELVHSNARMGRGNRQVYFGGGSGGCWLCRCHSGGHKIPHVQLSAFSVLLGSSNSFLAKCIFLTAVKGIKLLLFIFGNLLPKGRKGLHLPAPGVYMKLSGSSYLSSKYRCHPPSRWSPPLLSCLQGGHNESCGWESCSRLSGWNPFGKVSKLTYTVSWMLEVKVSQVNPCFSMMWKNNGSLFIICLNLNLSRNFIVTNFG